VVNRRAFIPASERPTAKKKTRAALFTNPWQALSALANMGLLVLAVAGYFLTVRPVYQKELLEEQTARMQKERLSLTDQLAQLNAQVAAAEKSLAMERVQAAQYREQAIREENEFRERLASETAAYLHQTNDAKDRLAAVEARAARWSADLKRSEVLHKHQEFIAQRCVHDFASSEQPLEAMFLGCMSVPNGLELSQGDYALLRDWTDFYARNIAATLAAPRESSLLYGWAALRRDFPESEVCWDDSATPLNAEQVRTCTMFKPMAIAISRAGDFGMALNEATRNVVAAVEAGATPESVRLHPRPAAPRPPPLVVIK
jgi:hypothetical protein